MSSVAPFVSCRMRGSGGGTCVPEIWYKTRETNQAKILSILAEVLLTGQYSQMPLVRIAHLLTVLRFRVVYPGSQSPIFIHPGFRILDIWSRIPDLWSQIPDPTTATKEEGEKLLFYLFWSHKFHKLFYFWTTTEKKFYLKNCLKNMGWGSGIWKKSISDPRILDPGVKKAPDPWSQIRICNTVCSRLDK
jgi:hypothetical protein